MNEAARVLDAAGTITALPWPALMAAIEDTLRAQRRGQVHVPERSVLPIAPQTAWLLMPAWTAPEFADLAMAKLITYCAGNPALGLPAIHGDVVVIKASTGERIALLDGPTVTARRTAAVTAVAARRLAARPDGPLLMFGAGVQARAHLEVFAEVFGTAELWLRSRTPETAQALLAHARALGLRARLADDLPGALQRCPVVIAATPARQVVLDQPPRTDAFVAALGAFTPAMAELDPAVTRGLARDGRVVLDTASARQEAGDLLQAGLATAELPVLGDCLDDAPDPRGRSALFKSCGSALWDLAAARCVQSVMGSKPRS